METSQYTPEGVSRRGWRLILAGVIALAVIGYAVGLRAGVPEGPPGVAEAARGSTSPGPQGDGIPVMSYDEVGAGALRSSEDLHTWAAMSAGLRAKASKPVTAMDARLGSLAQRSERRAFNGAPPVIPHDAHGLDDRSCLACHGQELKIADRVARGLPHPYLTNCTQCHVPAAPPIFDGKGGMLAASSWAGIPAPMAGVRATPGAPPAVPHTLHMRGSCLACHGEHGWPGMQTSHPERKNCLQCHAPIEDEAHPGRALTGPGFLPGPRVGSR